MPRPADETIGGGGRGGFGPGIDPSNLGQIDVSTIHQLDVDGATEGAKQLAAVFDKAGNIGQKLIKDQVDSNAKANSAQGEMDGLTGQVDQDKMGGTGGILGMSSAYADGVKRSQSQLTAYTASEKARALFAQNPNASLTDTKDVNGNNVPGLLRQVDNIFASDLPGADKDPTVASIVAPIMQHTLNELTAESYKNKILNDQQTAEDSAQASVMHDIQFGSNLFNAHQALDTLTKVYGGNNRQGRDSLIHAIGEAAVATSNPDAINKYLPPGIDFGGGATLTPENQQYLDQARNRAVEAQTRTNHVAANQAADNIADSMLSGKDPTAQLHDYFKMPGANAQQGLDMYNWYYRRGKEKETDAVDNSHVTWDIDRMTSTGEITNGGQLISVLTDKGIGNTALGNKIFQRGMGNIRSFQNTNADDPDFKAGMGEIAAAYSPAQDPITRKFINASANSQQAGAMYDYRVLYNQLIKTPNTSSTDAARKALAATKDKWGDSVEDQHGNLKSKGPYVAPASDVDQAAVIKNAGSNLAAFHASGIRAQDIDSLHASGMVGDADAARAYSILINKLQPK